MTYRRGSAFERSTRNRCCPNKRRRESSKLQTRWTSQVVLRLKLFDLIGKETGMLGEPRIYISNVRGAEDRGTLAHHPVPPSQLQTEETPSSEIGTM